MTVYPDLPTQSHVLPLVQEVPFQVQKKKIKLNVCYTRVPLSVPLTRIQKKLDPCDSARESSTDTGRLA